RLVDRADETRLDEFTRGARTDQHFRLVVVTGGLGGTGAVFNNENNVAGTIGEVAELTGKAERTAHVRIQDAAARLVAETGDGVDINVSDRHVVADAI